jgi:hypothetical protein
MGAGLDRFLAAGIEFEPADDGLLRAFGALTDELRAAIRAHKPAILAELANAKHYRWLVTLPDGTPFEVCCLPELTPAEMALLYRGTTVSPLRDAPEPPCHSATVEGRPEVTPDVE